jgi:hypothetical protein
MALVPIGLGIGRILSWQLSAGIGAAIVLGAVWFVVWKLAPMARSSPSFSLLLLIGGALFPPLVFGWLVGYNCRVRRAELSLNDNVAR